MRETRSQEEGGKEGREVQVEVLGKIKWCTSTALDFGFHHIFL
jgi:hypothetical protein